MKATNIFLQKLLNKKIPITRALGLKVEKFNERELLIKAPLKKNKNDKNTAFAGSLYSAAALSGWGFLTLKFMDEDINATVVMYTTNVLFNKPVQHDYYALCRLEHAECWEKFRNRVIKKKNGKMTLIVNIYDKKDFEEPKVKITAEYFAWLNA